MKSQPLTAHKSRVGSIYRKRKHIIYHADTILDAILSDIAWGGSLQPGKSKSDPLWCDIRRSPGRVLSGVLLLEFRAVLSRIAVTVQFSRYQMLIVCVSNIFLNLLEILAGWPVAFRRFPIINVICADELPCLFILHCLVNTIIYEIFLGIERALQGFESFFIG